MYYFNLWSYYHKNRLNFVIQQQNRQIKKNQKKKTKRPHALRQPHKSSADLKWIICGAQRVIWNTFEFFSPPLRSLPLSVSIPFFILLFEATASARRFISPNSHPTNDPNSCRRGEVNEVYSGVSGPPVSSCFLCAYISWCFLLLLTFKAPAAQSGLMEGRRHQLSTHGPNKWKRFRKSRRKRMQGEIYIGCMWDVQFRAGKYTKNKWGW